MQAADRYPANTCGGTDFVTPGKWEVKPGQQVIDLQVSLDDLPIESGWQLAIHQDTVANMMRCLRWPTPEDYAELRSQLDTAQADAELLRAALAEAQAETEEARAALATVTKVQRAKAGAPT